MTDMGWMFSQASAFNRDLPGILVVLRIQQFHSVSISLKQNLCQWGRRLPATADVTSMFSASNCPNRSDPILQEDDFLGPWCYNCENEILANTTKAGISCFQ